LTILLKVVSAVLAVLFWQCLALMLPEAILPGPVATVQALIGEFKSNNVALHLYTTMVRVTGGLLLAMAVGVPIGILMGLSRVAAQMLDVWVMIALTVPSLCYALVCFIWFGLNEFSAILAIAITGAPSIVINLWEGVKGVDTKLIKMARAYEATSSQIFNRVLLPQVLPYIIASTRFSLGVIWKITVLVELIGRPDGVGFQLFYWYQLADMPRVLAWTLLFTIIVLAIELLLIQPIERRLFAWRPRVTL
jgi:NitT/TauT family transport system permease protein